MIAESVLEAASSCSMSADSAAAASRSVGAGPTAVGSCFVTADPANAEYAVVAFYSAAADSVAATSCSAAVG